MCCLLNWYVLENEFGGPDRQGHASLIKPLSCGPPMSKSACALAGVRTRGLIYLGLGETKIKANVRVTIFLSGALFLMAFPPWSKSEPMTPLRSRKAS